MKSIKISNLGPIGEADIQLGDLTILVGPQASGKSLFLQMIKLIIDYRLIGRALERYSFNWNRSFKENLELFFGEGMGGIFKFDTKLWVDGEELSVELLGENPINTPENSGMKVFYVPAHRVSAMAEGRAKLFSEWDNAPFVVRVFGEFIMFFMSKILKQEENWVWDSSEQGKTLDSIFESHLEELISKTIYQGGSYQIDSSKGKRRLQMSLSDGSKIPYISWSTGQREATPMWFAIRYLMNVSPAERGNAYEIIIIEEPEMGLHPKAILAMLLSSTILTSKGYKVMLSTHSPMVMEFAWAVNILQRENGTIEDFAELFEISNPEDFSTVLSLFLKKTIKTYFFDNSEGKVKVRDISSLDAGSTDPAVADWGGLSSFAERAGNLVAKVVSRNF